MRLATIEDILQYIRFDSIEEINASFDSALLTASVTLSAILQTEFDRIEAAVDYFYVEHTEFIGNEYSLYFELTNGFVDKTKPVTITYSPLMSTIESAPISIPSPLIRHENGVILISGVNLDNMYVKVAYSSGFEVEDDPPVYVGVPEWLKRCAVLQALLEFDRANPDFRKEQSGGSFDLSAMQTHLAGMVEKHVRYNPQCITPII